MSSAINNIEHRFYQKTLREQKHLLRGTIAVVVLICTGIVFTAYLSEMYYLIFLITLVLQLAAPFIDTPLGRKSGKLVYYSPLFIAEQEKKNTIVIHGGTLFDYLFVLKPAMSGPERKKIVLALYIQGLRALAEECEKQGKSHMKIRGTSYILNRRTAEKAGMKAVKRDTAQYLLLRLNYLLLFLGQSYIAGKLSLPDISRVQTFEGNPGDVLEKIQNLTKLEEKLSTGTS